MPLHRVDFQKPHPLFDVAATRRIEQAAFARVHPHTLMQRAGLAVARLGLALAPHSRTIWIACGPGNNGGDGLEAAMHLKNWGKNPIVTWLGDAAQCPDDARASLQRARSAGVLFAREPPRDLDAADLAIDALLGVGATRPPEGKMLDWLLRMNRGAATLLAVDLPSGLSADTGVYAPGMIAAQDQYTRALGTFGTKNTISLLNLKPGLFTGHGRDAAGSVWLDDLGCDPGSEPPTAMLIGAPTERDRLHSSHKGSFGDIAVIGGAPGMTGAVLLAATAALFGGAGRVYACPLDGGALLLDPGKPDLMFRQPNALDLAKLTVVCGCGGGDAVKSVLPRVLEQAERALLDADALNAVAADPALQDALKARATRGQGSVLTPHPLEAARLLGSDAKSVQADRLAAATQLAHRFGCTVVLKGSGTVIAEPGRRPAINPTGNARLATAGTGDVLAGMVGARWAASESGWDAACAAVYHHGLVADRWPEGQPLTASRLARGG